MMAFSPLTWHERYKRQAQWTQALRAHLFSQFITNNTLRTIEIGCGSGVILNELSQYSQASILGIDIDSSFLQLAMRSSPSVGLIQADAHHLPINTAVFDITVCHFLLLWVSNPQRVLYEMARITRPGGLVCALAEPDYGGRIDFPPKLAILGQYQAHALEQQGANPGLGRELRSLFTRVGLVDITSGILGGQWQPAFDQAEWESEWAVLENDLEPFPDLLAECNNLKAQDLSAWEIGERILFVPTFYAWGKVKD